MNSQDIGQLVAFAFYSAALHRAKPSHTHPFTRGLSVGISLAGKSSTVNILCRLHLDDPDLESTMQHRLEALSVQHSDVVYKGIVTTRNCLISPIHGQLHIIGSPLKLDDFEDGPILRIDPPVRKMRLRIIEGGKPTQG